LLFSASAAAQAILILPFENHSRGSALDWVGESAAEGLAAHWRFSETSAARAITGELRYVIRREERVAAFDQLGLPPSVSLSHATAIKIGEITGADLLIFGSFEGDADHLTLSAQVLEMRHPHLEPPSKQSGPLADLLAMQDRLAADLAAKAGISASPGTGAGTATLEAWELYIRGLTAGPSPQQFKYFLEATRLDPAFLAPAFQLGRISFQSREYSDAVKWLEKLAPESPNYLEARFLEGLADYHLRQYERAEGAFLAVTATIPLNEAFNNLGVVQMRERKRPAALENLEKALEGDPNDTDYAYNLACYYLRAGDFAQATRRFREVLAKKPLDPDAKLALADAVAERVSEFPERLKYNFEEAKFRQLRLALARASREKDNDKK